MSFEILQYTDNVKGLKLDPRTKLLLLITVATIVLGGIKGGVMSYVNLLFCLIPFVLIVAVKPARAITYIIFIALAICLKEWALPLATGLTRMIIVASCELLLRFMPSVMMGYYMLISTTVSEFVASLLKMRFPSWLVIPLSVMFRFFPTIVNEHSAINDAMKMRGIRLCGGKAGKMLEYRLVPLMASTVKIGEELSAAALTRGLGKPVKRTNICEIGFQVTDIILIIICMGALGAVVICSLI